jgi:Ca-activated chloride channel family protein
MSFGEPTFLLALLLAPLAVLAYREHERRRRAQADAFSTPATLPSVLPERPGWRRHAALLGYAVASLLLVVALARPQLAIGTDEGRTDLVLAIDRSSSMKRDDIPPSRIEASREAAGEFVADAPGRARVGLVTFNGRVSDVEPPSRDREAVERALERMRPRGATDLAEALSGSLELLGAGGDGRDKELQVRGHPGGHSRHLLGSRDLEPVRPVVVEAVDLEQIVEPGDDLVAPGHRLAI